MNTGRFWRALLLTVPLWLGVAANLLLDRRTDSLVPASVQISIAPGDLSLLLGTLVTGTLLGIYTLYLYRQQRQAEEAAVVSRRAADLRYRFLSQLNHELKNPLMALRAGIAYLAGEEQIADYHQAIAELAAQVDRIGRLITDLRKLADLDEIEIEWQRVDLLDLLTEVQEAASGHPAYAEHEIQLVVLKEAGTLPPVRGDRGLLWLAFFNLLENAIKFSPPGSSIEVRLFETEKNIVVEIQDSGPGIKSEELPLIFEELYRGENAFGTPGSGLGLPLVRRVLDRHNGRIMVHSRLGRGTVVTLHLPKEKALSA